MPASLQRRNLTLDAPATLWRDPQTGRINVSVNDSRLQGDVRLSARPDSEGDQRLGLLFDMHQPSDAGSSTAQNLEDYRQASLTNTYGHFRFHRASDHSSVTVYAEPVLDAGVQYGATATAYLDAEAGNVSWVEEHIYHFVGPTARAGTGAQARADLLSVSPVAAARVMDTVRSVTEMVMRDVPGWHRAGYSVQEAVADRIIELQAEWARGRRKNRRRR